MRSSTDFPRLLQTFFTERLMGQRRASPHTVASYRDTFRLLLGFVSTRTGKSPSKLAIQDIDADLIVAFLDDLESRRGIGARSRNQRLAGIKSFFHFAAYEAPEAAALIARVNSIPTKRHDKKLIDFMTRDECEVLLRMPDRETWTGRRDYALFLVAIQTGLRVSELCSLTRANVILDHGAHIRCTGKGRKERCTPLTKQTVAILREWVTEIPSAESAPFFPNARGGHLSPDGVQYALAKYVAMAKELCPTLAGKRISPHVLRHTCAIQLLQAGVDSALISLWLGHESIETTRIYVDANLAMKEDILRKTSPVNGQLGRFKPSDQLMDFLRTL